MGVKGKPKGVYVLELPDLKKGLRENAPMSNKIDSHGPKKEANVYTGDYIKGIATMHKSNAVPITSKEQAIDSAQMRRN